MSFNKKSSREKLGGFIYSSPPKSEPKRNEIVKFSTWRMRLYQELQSTSYEDLQKKGTQTADKMFPKLCQTTEEQQFYEDIFSEYTQSHEDDAVSYFTCLMLYSRDIRNHDTFVKMEKLILSLRLDRLKNSPSKMNVLKELIVGVSHLQLNDLHISREDFQQNESRITHWYDKNEVNNQTVYMKIPFEYGEVGLKKRKCYIQKGFVYADIEAAVEIVKNLYVPYLKEKILKVRSQTQKLLQNDIQNQIKPFMDKAINSVNASTIDQSEINSQFKLNLKNIDAVSKKYFPPCMLHLNKKLKQNNHLKHEGRRQLWLFFKGCGMDVNDNKQYFSKYLSLKVSNSELKNHMYNIEHTYGLVGNKKQPERPKMCRAIITGSQPKKDEHHGCPFRHWSKEVLAEFLRANYSLNEEDFQKIMLEKEKNSFQVACGRLFDGNFRPEDGSLPPQITQNLGKSPHQYFISGMEATQWINTKTLRPTNKKPSQVQKIELEF